MWKSNRMNKRLAFLLFIIILGGVFWFFKDSFLGSKLTDISEPSVLQFEKVSEKVAEIVKREIVAPPPLRVEKKATPKANLTPDGILAWTNAERKKAGLPLLTANSKLSAAALAKAKDMFQNQYFAHESPGGKGVGDLVAEENYEFISVGENLALGGFENDKALVDAWMNSPGHSANILGQSWLEIGVAVGRGMFEGRDAWLAVQHFAKPLSACPQPDPNLKIGIESSEKKVGELTAMANQLRAELENSQPKNRKEIAEYNQRVGEHNALANQINTLVEATKLLINTYNSQIRALNQCIAE